jgi:hypothetical protein
MAQLMLKIIYCSLHHKMADYFMRELHEVEWGAYNKDSMQDILGRLVAAIVQKKRDTTISLQRDWERVLKAFEFEDKGVPRDEMIEDIVKVLRQARGRDLSVWHQILCPLSSVRVRHGRLDMVRVVKLFSQIEYFLSKINDDARYSQEAQAIAKGDAIVSATQAGLYLDQAMYFPRTK